MPTSKDTRVRVEGWSKIIASVRPASGFASDALPSLARRRFIAMEPSTMPRSSAAGTASRSRKCRGGAGRAGPPFSVMRHP